MVTEFKRPAHPGRISALSLAVSLMRWELGQSLPSQNYYNETG